MGNLDPQITLTRMSLATCWSVPRQDTEPLASEMQLPVYTNFPEGINKVVIIIIIIKIIL